MQIGDITGLSQPLTKLVETVSAGIGTLYRPMAIRREGAAEAEKLLLIERAKAQASEDGKAIAQAAHISRLRDLEADPLFLERARVRLVVKELEGQHNIERIADAAVKYLPGEASDAPVATEWRRRFFGYAEDVADADVQQVWAKLLAGEVAQPGRFSVRTLSVLHQLSRSEAEMFERLAALAFDDGSIYRTPFSYWVAWLEQYGITRDEILQLHACQLLQPSDDVTVQTDFGQPVTWMLQGEPVEVSRVDGSRFTLPVLRLTPAGVALLGVVRPALNRKFFEDIRGHLIVNKHVIKASGAAAFMSGPPLAD